MQLCSSIGNEAQFVYEAHMHAQHSNARGYKDTENLAPSGIESGSIFIDLQPVLQLYVLWEMKRNIDSLGTQSATSIQDVTYVSFNYRMTQTDIDTFHIEMTRQDPLLIV